MASSQRATAAEVIDLTNSDDEPGSTVPKNQRLNDHLSAHYINVDANPQLRNSVLRNNMHMTGAQRGLPSSASISTSGAASGATSGAATLTAGSERPSASSTASRSSPAQMSASVPHHSTPHSHGNSNNSNNNSSPVQSTRSSPSAFITARQSNSSSYQNISPSSPASGPASGSASGFGRDRDHDRDHQVRGVPSRSMHASSSTQQSPTSDDRARQHDHHRAGLLSSQSQSPQQHAYSYGRQQEHSAGSSSNNAAVPIASSSSGRPQVRSGAVHPSYVKPVPPIRLSPDDQDNLDAGIGARHGPSSQYFGRRPEPPLNAADRHSGLGTSGIAKNAITGAGGNNGRSSQSPSDLIKYAISSNAAQTPAAQSYRPQQQLRHQQQASRMYPSPSSQAVQGPSNQPGMYSNYQNRQASQQSHSPQQSPQVASSPRWPAPQHSAQQQQQQRSPPNPSYPSPTLQSSSWAPSQHHHSPPSQITQLPGATSSSLSPRQNQQPPSRSPHTSQIPSHSHSHQQSHQQSHRTSQSHQQQTHSLRQQQPASQQQAPHHHHHHPHHNNQPQQQQVRQAAQQPVPQSQILTSNSTVYRQPPSPSSGQQSPHLLGSRQSSLNANASPRQSLPLSHPHAKNANAPPHLSPPVRNTSSPGHLTTSAGSMGQTYSNPGRSFELSDGQREHARTGSGANSPYTADERPGLSKGGTPRQHQHGHRSSGHWPDGTTQPPGQTSVHSINSHGGKSINNDITTNGNSNSNSNSHRLGTHHYTYTRQPPLSASGESVVQDGSADKNVPHLTLVPMPVQTPPGSRPGSASSRVHTPASASRPARPTSYADNEISDRRAPSGPVQPLSSESSARVSPVAMQPVVLDPTLAPTLSTGVRTAESNATPEMNAFPTTPASPSMNPIAISEATPRPARKAPAPKPLSKASDWSVAKLESALQGFLKSLQVDHGVALEYFIDIAQPRVRKFVSSFDDFADMPALQAESSSSETITVRWKLHRDNQRRPEGRSTHVQVTSLKSPGQRVPRYRFHHVEIAKNILSPNTPLKFIPHIRDLEDGSEDKYKYEQWIEELESMERKSGFDSSVRSDKRATTRHQEFIKLLSGYLDRWIASLRIENCSKATLIRYMADEPRNGQANITPQQKNSLLMSCGGDAATPQAMMFASMFTDAFNRVFKSENVKLHDVLKQDETVENVLEPKKTTKTKDQDKNDSIEQVQQYLGTYTSLKCMICNTHSCEHGEFDSENVRRCFSIDDLGSKLWKHVERRRNRQIKEQIQSKSIYSSAPSVSNLGNGHVAIGNSLTSGAMWKPCNNQCYQSYEIGDSSLVTRDWTEDETNLVRSFHLTFANSSGKVPCTVCNMINRNCWEVYRHIKELGLVVSLRPPTPPTIIDTGTAKNINWYDRKKRQLNGDWSEHTITHFHALREQREPCNHDGPCTAARDCPCVKAKILCERFCRCTADCCAYKFTGCGCHATGKTCYARQKEGRPCICVQLNRECDPILCGGCGARQRADPENRDNDELHATGCQNVSLQRGKSKSVVLGQSQLEGCGYGLFTAEDISAEDFIIEYIGELITHDEGVRREARRGDVFNQESNASYLFTLLEQDGIWVDAAIYGNLSRYINHASEHDKRGCNITPKIMYVNGEFRIRFSAMRDIKAGEELFFNYGENFPNLTKKLLEDKASASDDEEMSTAGSQGGTRAGGARGGNNKARANRSRNNKSAAAGQANNRRKVQTTRAPTKSVQSAGPSNSRASANNSNIRKRVRGKGARKEAPPATAPAVVDISSGLDDLDDLDSDFDEMEETEYAASQSQSQMDIDDPPSGPVATVKNRTGTKRKRRTVYDDEDGDDENEATGQDDEDVQMRGADNYAGVNDNDDNTDPVFAGPRRRRKHYQPTSQRKQKSKSQFKPQSTSQPQSHSVDASDNDNHGSRNTRRRPGPGLATLTGLTPAEIAAATGGVVNIFADGLEVPRRRRRKRNTIGGAEGGSGGAAGDSVSNLDGANDVDEADADNYANDENDDNEPSITAVRPNRSKAAQVRESPRRGTALSIELPTIGRVRRIAANNKAKQKQRKGTSPTTASNSYTDNDDSEHQQPRRKRPRTRLLHETSYVAVDSDDSSFAAGSSLTHAGPDSRPTSQPLSRLRRARHHRVPDSADDETSEFDIVHDDDGNVNVDVEGNIDYDNESAPASAVVALGTTDDDQGSVMSAGHFYGRHQGQSQSQGQNTQLGTAADTPANTMTASGRRRRIISDSEDEADDAARGTSASNNANHNKATSIVATSSFSPSQSMSQSMSRSSSIAVGGRITTSRPHTPHGNDDDLGSEVSSSVDRSQRRRQKPARYRSEHK